MGFTLVEILVVMVLIGLLAAIALPRFGRDRFGKTPRTALEALIFRIESAKRSALIEQRPYALFLNITDNRYRVTGAPEDKTTSGESDRDRPTGDADVTLPNGLTLNAVVFPGVDPIETGSATIHFYKDGHCDPAVVILEDGDGNRFRIRIETFLPRVRLETDADAT